MKEPPEAEPVAPRTLALLSFEFLTWLSQCILTGQLSHVLEVLRVTILEDDGAAALAASEGEGEGLALLNALVGVVGELGLGSSHGGDGENGSSVLHCEGWR